MPEIIPVSVTISLIVASIGGLLVGTVLGGFITLYIMMRVASTYKPK